MWSPISARFSAHIEKLPSQKFSLLKWAQTALPAMETSMTTKAETATDGPRDCVAAADSTRARASICSDSKTELARDHAMPRHRRPAWLPPKRKYLRMVEIMGLLPPRAGDGDVTGSDVSLIH